MVKLKSQPKTYTENEVVKIILSLRETLSDLEHKQWSHWTNYYLNAVTFENKKMWKKEIETAYKDLSEKQKDSDRVWADKVISTILNKFMTPAGFRNAIEKSNLSGFQFGETNRKK